MSSGPSPSLAGWGRIGVPGRERRSEDLRALSLEATLVRGLGRSYGDASLPRPGTLEVLGSTLADRILAFDPETGYFRAEAGLSLRELNRIFLPRRWFVPVTPGTQEVTLGGMVAADVHGKNHHVEGCFGAHVEAMLLRVADGSLVECTPESEGELFRATVGGMGLTGHILEVAFRLRRIPTGWIVEESHRLPNLEAMVEALAKAAPSWPFTVCWLDALARGRSLGRGTLIAGRWAEPGEAPERPPGLRRARSVPFGLPSGVVALFGKPFNAFYYRLAPSRTRRRLVSPDTFFYPLDIVRDWNRLYGRRGFIQYQCVLPREAGPESPRRVLEELHRQGGKALLAVLKDCGAEGEGLLSFPHPGLSMALDIPADEGTQGLVDALNERVLAEGGRIYLAKDGHTRAEHFRAMEPRLGAFLETRDRWDPDRRIGSAMSARLFGDR